ncbi:MAG: aspartate--tRNA ligase [Candidatus Omnitrophota bacterium]
MLRTHSCGELTDKDLGKRVTLCGWVHSRRDHGNLIFIDLRDRYGITQVVFNPELNRDMHRQAEGLRSEYVIQAGGAVCRRPEGTENNKLKTGRIELSAESLTVLNRAETPPFSIDMDDKVSDELRFAYRYLDLRKPALQKKLMDRHRLYMAIRNFLDGEGFVEVETPVLTKSTPEGARDYLVPSRVNPGSFFALPQSPQLFKQILMVAGFEKYFQVAKCFRDEDLRADRQPEFTQLDMEMSFVTEEDIYEVCERLMRHMVKEVIDKELSIPFPRLAYNDAMERYGSDKPDTRFGMELINLNHVFKDTAFKVFKAVLDKGNSIIGMVVKGAQKDYPRSKLDELIGLAKDFGAGGLVHLKVERDKIDSPVAKFFKPEELSGLKAAVNAQQDDLILIVADDKRIAREVMGRLRLFLGKRHNLIDENRLDFVWIVDFPLFKYNDEEKRWDMEHHPFTSPKPNRPEELSRPPGEIMSNSYDLVFNGAELASGSIRIHDSKVQERIFQIIGLDDKEVQERFGFLLKAFSYGAPPHGGIAFGLDRLMAMFTGSDTIKDVIAFPKTQKAVCPMTGAPSGVSGAQLKELGLKQA